jgi:hypothetical protein
VTVEAIASQRGNCLSKLKGSLDNCCANQTEEKPMNIDEIKAFLESQSEELSLTDYLALAKVAIHAAFLASSEGEGCDPQVLSHDEYSLQDEDFCHFQDAAQSQLDELDFWWFHELNWNPILEIQLSSTHWINLAQWLLERAAQARQESLPYEQLQLFD